MSTARSSDVCVIGGGVIGLAVAWRAASSGTMVTVVDESPGSGASWAAAGMLAPVTEVHYGEEALLQLNLESARRYPSFVEELEYASGAPAGYRACGTLVVALDRDENAILDDLHVFQTKLELPAQRLGARECRELEPALSPRVRGGILCEGDHQIDNRALVAALMEACKRADVGFIGARVDELLVTDGAVTGARLEDGDEISCATAVLTAGCWSSSIRGIPPDVRVVRPVKGQLVHLKGPAEPALINRTVRRAGGDYVVPRSDGRVVVGATVEEMGVDTTVTAGAVYSLLRDAYEVLPGITELELTETVAGLRPGTPDNAPLLGLCGTDGLVVATGHYRNGILLAPVTADAIAEVVTSGDVPDLIAPFSPQRFRERARMAG